MTGRGRGRETQPHVNGCILVAGGDTMNQVVANLVSFGLDIIWIEFDELSSFVMSTKLLIGTVCIPQICGNFAMDFYRFIERKSNVY